MMMDKTKKAFDQIADQYQKKALVQQQAAHRLIELLQIKSQDQILDLGCGPGHLTYALSKCTRGRALGTDISESMIQQARELYPDLEFKVQAAEDLDWQNRFHIVFCNSVLQWFVEPEKVFTAVYQALKPGGRLGVACPATAHWSPWFEEILPVVTQDPEIQPTFQHWHNPWFFLPTEEDYRKFFEKQRFTTIHCEVVLEPKEYLLDQAYGIYLSGAANGLVGKAFYTISINDDYIRKFNQKIQAAIEKHSQNGRILVDFNRLYYVGTKPALL